MLSTDFSRMWCNDILTIRTGKMCSTEVAAIECPAILFDNGNNTQKE